MVSFDIRLGNALLSMFVRLGNLNDAWYVFGRMEERDLFSWNVMVGGYAKAGFFDEAINLYHRMMWVGIKPDEYTFPCILRTCGVLFSACEVVDGDRLGMEVHGYIVSSGLIVEVSVCNSLIQMYMGNGNLVEADKVFANMQCKDVLTWTSMISGYEDNGFPERALRTYELMENEGIMPDEITIASAVSACASLSLLDMGMKLHDLAVRTGYISYVIVSNTLIEMYSKCKYMTRALEVFYQIKEKNVISWTSIISGLSQNNRSFEALFFFRQMKLSLNPNSITLVTALSACARIGALMCGKEIHAYALRTTLAFDGYVPNAILDMYVRCGRMALAWNQFNGSGKDIAAWNTMLTGYADRKLGTLAVEFFHKMLDSDVNPDEITFISLLCACSRSGMVAQGLEFFDNMENKYHVSRNLKHYACVVDLLGACW
ncbi:hypothetical protein RDABS01_011835 [Bienertia sinuspersici]